jgi:hypothetical protein
VTQIAADKASRDKEMQCNAKLPMQPQPENPPLASEKEEIGIDSVDLSSVPPLFHGSTCVM